MTDLHRWFVAGGLIEGPDGLLLVRNRRRGGREDWTTPGGVIDPGEGAVEALSREVAEETGLVVDRWDGPVYEVEAVAPDLGWELRVEVHRAVAVAGSVAVDDPDGIVVEASYLSVEHCTDRLTTAPRWVHEPLTSWLHERWDRGRTFRYEVRGRDLSDLRVRPLRDGEDR